MMIIILMVMAANNNTKWTGSSVVKYLVTDSWWRSLQQLRFTSLSNRLLVVSGLQHV